jgi:hypothetical protein
VVWGLVGLASVAWFVVARSILKDQSRALDRASLSEGQKLLQYTREQVQLRLRGQTQLLAEDPRLKSTLTTPGIDEATIRDVLTDLKRLSGTDFLAVLTPNATVQSVVGNDALAGLNLGASAVVEGARRSDGGVSGLWVVGDRLVDVSVTALRFDNRISAYLVAGDELDEKAVEGLSALVDSAVGIIVGGKVSVAASVRPGELKAMEAVAADEAGGDEPREFSHQGDAYLAQVTEVKGAVPAAQIALVRPADLTFNSFSILKLLLWLPMLAAAIHGCYSAWRSSRPER